MSRSSWKNFFLSKNIKTTSTKEDAIFVWERNSVIPAFLINKKVFVHNGNSFRAVQVTSEKVGFKFGEFSFTRKKINKASFLKNKKLTSKKATPLKK